MAWRDNLRPASFRNVAFHVESATLTAGRRLARHEYPQRDVPYMEDMGRKAREYKVDALVVGPDYMEQRDALIRALETAGAGQLVHPYHGTLQVVVAGDCQVSESTAQGGMAKISIPFIEAGQQLEPTVSRDTQAVLGTQYTASQDAFAASFAQRFSVTDKPDFVAADALTNMNALLAVPGVELGNAAWLRANPTSAMNALLPENLQASLANPLALARGVLQLVSSASGLSRLLGFGLPTVATGVYTVGRMAQNTNRAALSGLVVQAATARRIMELTSTTPLTLDDARSARAEIVRRTDVLLLDPATGQQAADALVQLRTDAVAHFAAITPYLPRLSTLQPQVVRPALVQAYDFYGDAWLAQGREQEIIDRNRVQHPGFVPAGRALTLVS